MRPVTLTALLLTLLAAGCGGSADRFAPVRGTVFYKAAPLRQGSIVFTPDPLRGGSGPLARAEIQPDGSYSLQTDGGPGAVPGWHRITVMGPSPRSDPGHSRKTEGGPRLPLQYSDPQRSGQRYEVEPGRANVLELHLE